MTQIEQYNYILGTQAFSTVYHFSDKCAESEIADRIVEMGSTMIKFHAQDDDMIDALMAEHSFSHVFMWYRSHPNFRNGYA